MGHHLTAIVLAAGRSTRMGARNKLLLPVGDGPMIRRSIEALVQAPIADIIVVTGHQRASVEAALAGLPVRVVYNPDHGAGMGMSIRRGAEAAHAETDGYVIGLGDLPQIRPGTVHRLVEAFYGAPTPSVVIPTYRGKRGHPVLFHGAFGDDLRELGGDRGARSVLQRHPEAVLDVPVEDPGVVQDIDTPDAYAALRRRPAPDEDPATEGPREPDESGRHA